MGQLLLKFISSLLGEWEGERGGRRGREEGEGGREGGEREGRRKEGASAVLTLTLFSQWKTVVL